MDRRVIALTLTLLLALASVAGARMNPVMLGGGAITDSGMSLLGSWLLDDNATGTVVTAAAGNNGTLYGVADSSEVSTTDAHTGRAFSLADASGDYVTIPVPTFSAWQNKFTVEFWVKGLKDYNVDNAVLFSIGPATGDRKFMISQNSKDLKVANYIGGTLVSSNIYDYASDTEWKTYHHVKVQYDVSAGVIKLSINEGSVATFTGHHTTWANTPVVFGLGYGGYGEVGGFIIDDVKFYAGGDL